MTTIVLIDDDRMITEPLSRSLRQQGFEVFMAHNGRSGLALALEKKPDIVVLDIMMPEMDGWEVCRELRAKSPVPILMLTALNEEIDRILGLELGADDYLTKPFSTRELLARIKAMLRRVELDRAVVEAQLLEMGGITLNLDTRQALKGEQVLELRYKEVERLS